GFSIVIHPGAIGRFIGKQVGEFLQQLRDEGTTASMLDRMLDFDTQNEVVGLADFLRTQQRYGARAGTS
ncbi:MAG: carboxyvinyl-carboxyphosphonate phosphorylmutase, partial [Gammaproteobacteria bacterium]